VTLTADVFGARLQHRSHAESGDFPVGASIERASPAESAGDSGGDVWPTPNPIIAELKPIPAFDAETLLPDALRLWIMDEAERMPCPPEFIAAGALVAIWIALAGEIPASTMSSSSWCSI